ncbi:hypothetical protein BD410DRAFT_137012 [Rickenella mellea]|uniref:Uncharacterized protein n=1 Tax=Rickenella mellea TaxID=50990 RepID=A0A4Y7PI37_9AGAM|nr:hypothetical protein BD410DRAFT_137012 [Rickenella mellea]
MSRSPEELQLHTLAAESYNDSQHNLPLYATEARAHELEFKHPQITGYRALVLTLTLAFGIPKATLMFLNRNNPAASNAATSLDLAFSAICATALYWLGLYEESHPPWMHRWLFSAKNTQTAQSLGNEWHHPRLTTYRFVVLALPILFGSWKAALMYKGQSTTPNMLEWQFGVIGIIWLFWLGWFEECHPDWMHPNFAEDDKGILWRLVSYNLQILIYIRMLRNIGQRNEFQSDIPGSQHTASSLSSS